jgi:hypothetical protein
MDIDWITLAMTIAGGIASVAWWFFRRIADRLKSFDDKLDNHVERIARLEGMAHEHK